MFRRFIILFLVLPAICLGESRFEYGGLSLKTDPQGFVKRYPSSTVQGGEVWLSKIDSHDEIHYIQRRNLYGKEELRISFEKPADQLDKKFSSWEAGHYARHPKCNDILKQLTEIYGRAIKKSPRVVERITEQDQTWSNGMETMALTCYAVDGKGASLAADLLITSK